MKKIIGLLAGLTVFLSFSTVVFSENNEEPPLQELDHEFQNLIEAETEDSSWKVSGYESAEALEAAFHSIMSEELAETYLTQYFKKEDGTYYKLPQDGPAYIEFDQPYDLEKKGENHYRLTQERFNELRGEFTLTIDYHYTDGQWIMADRNNRTGAAEGGQLADTATFYPIWTLIGILLIAAAFPLLMWKRNTSIAN